MLRAEAGFKISSENYLTCADFPQLKARAFLLVLIVAFTILFLFSKKKKKKEREKKERKKKKSGLFYLVLLCLSRMLFLEGHLMKAKENDSSPLLVLVTKISLGECFHFRLKQSVYYSNRTIGI